MPHDPAPSPLRVAIIGAGPAGFYAAEHLCKQDDTEVLVDLFDKLPTPHGLVRGGVAPDHQKIKRVSRVFEATAAKPQVRFFGNVAYGEHIRLDDLRRFYHAVVISTGTQEDRKLGIPGEDLDGSHSATEFVAWYNGHPDYRDRTFDLSQERVVVVGVGNVAVDVCRILCRTIEELETTDIADYALEALRESRVREVVMLGRRGPAQAAFTTPEIKELGELRDADLLVSAEDITLDPLSAADLEANPDRQTSKKLDILRAFADHDRTEASRTLTLRFLVSPVELIDDGSGHVDGVRIVHNELYRTDDGRLRPRATDREETLPAGLVFRAVGYRGRPLPDLPFHERWGIIPNREGRVVAPGTDEPILGLYVAGWIKRGPSGVIGTNKPDAVESIEALLEDYRAGRLTPPPAPDPSAVEMLLRDRQPDLFSYEDWCRLNDEEVERGKLSGRPRVKFTSVEEMVATKQVKAGSGSHSPEDSTAA